MWPAHGCGGASAGPTPPRRTWAPSLRVLTGELVGTLVPAPPPRLGFHRVRRGRGGLEASAGFPESRA